MPGGCGRSRTPPHPDVEVPGRLQGQDGEGQALDGTDLELMSPPTASKGKSNTIGIAPGAMHLRRRGNWLLSWLVAVYPRVLRNARSQSRSHPSGGSAPPLHRVSWPAEELDSQLSGGEHPVRSGGGDLRSQNGWGSPAGPAQAGRPRRSDPAPSFFANFLPANAIHVGRATPACTPTSKGVFREG